MKHSITAPAVGGAALERLQDEQRQIDGLLTTLMHSPPPDAADRERIESLALTLLRVHDALEATLLQPALEAHVPSPHPVLQRAASTRSAVRDAADRLEALPADAADRAAALATLATHTRQWFAAEEGSLFALMQDLAQNNGLDLAALDAALATRQEALLSAGSA